MWNVVFLLFATAGVLLAVNAWRCARSDIRAAAAACAPRRNSARRTAASTPAPQPQALAPLAWNEPHPARAALSEEELRERLRDRYLSARFPGLLATANDLDSVDDMVRAARLLFEEERDDHAHELLGLAIARSPQNEPLRLAQIEIAFLRRSRTRFIALAAQFKTALPQSRNWGEIARLGRAIAPEVALFAAGPGSRPHEHYGPWPDLPNWIQASWDLTAEVLAADFRRGILRGPSAVAADQRIALGA